MQATKWIAIALTTLVGCASARGNGGALTTRTPLVGSWHLASLDLPGANGAVRHITDAKGSLIYTSTGRVAVQVMYARADSTPASGPVQYALGGYEGSFGRYVVDEATHTVTHRYEGTNVRSLLGQALPRRYEIADGKLTIRSTRSDEHWSVLWERD